MANAARRATLYTETGKTSKGGAVLLKRTKASRPPAMSLKGKLIDVQIGNFFAVDLKFKVDACLNAKILDGALDGNGRQLVGADLEIQICQRNMIGHDDYFGFQTNRPQVFQLHEVGESIRIFETKRSQVKSPGGKFRRDLRRLRGQVSFYPAGHVILTQIKL